MLNYIRRKLDTIFRSLDSDAFNVGIVISSVIWILIFIASIIIIFNNLTR